MCRKWLRVSLYLTARRYIYRETGFKTSHSLLLIIAVTLEY